VVEDQLIKLPIQVSDNERICITCRKKSHQEYYLQRRLSGRNKELLKASAMEIDRYMALFSLRWNA
jgi:hypothetical protein